MISDGAAVRLGLLKGPEGLEGVGAHGHLGHIDIAVIHGDHAQVLLADGLPFRGKLGHRSAWGRLRRLPAGVRVDLGVQHQDLHIAARGKNVVQSAETDVIGPAVAADDPDAPPDQGVGHRQERARLGRIERAPAAP